MTARVDYTGRRYGLLTVVGRKDVRRSGRMVPILICNCDCGGKKEALYCNLLSGCTKSCGCLIQTCVRGRKSAEHKAKVDIYAVYRRNAKLRNKVWDLTADQLLAIITQPCAYCGDKASNRLHGFPYNGVDRVDNELGYTIDNCVPCCKTCNQAKSDRSLGTFKIWIKRIYVNLFHV